MQQGQECDLYPEETLLKSSEEEEKGDKDHTLSIIESDEKEDRTFQSLASSSYADITVGP